MGYFQANLPTMKTKCTELAGYEKAMASQYDSIEYIRNNLSISGKGTSQIKQQLKSQMESIRELERQMHNYKEGLEEIARIYGLHEALLLNQASVLKFVGEGVIDFLQDVKEGCVDRYEDWVTKRKNRNESVTYRIDDEATRNGFTDDYREILQVLYEDVPGEYLVTRALYDKYSEDVMVGDFYAVDSKGNTSAYYSPTDGKIYINTNADVSNMRGDGTTFYHEYGHYVVDQEKWIKGGECVGDFARFEAAVKKEIKAYYTSIENEIRAKLIAEETAKSGTRFFTDEQLLKIEKKVTEQTTAAIKTDICGSGNETYHVNNGLSDIIDGVSNGKYQPSYGHDVGYWDKDPSRVANEAFAQFFSAQMTGDTVEMEKMKELMPEAYDIYMDMVSKAAGE